LSIKKVNRKREGFKIWPDTTLNGNWGSIGVKRVPEIGQRNEKYALEVVVDRQRRHRGQCRVSSVGYTEDGLCADTLRAEKREESYKGKEIGERVARGLIW